MTGWFVVSIIKRRNDIADVAWGLGFVMLAWLAFYLGGYSVRSLVVNGLVSMWGLRLAWHIFSRNRKKKEDYRYKKWGGVGWLAYVRSFVQVFLLQGALMLVIASPVVYVNLSANSGWGLLDWVGLVVWLIGFSFEVVADWQLKKFLEDKNNKGKIVRDGLWRYSRHPNYFGEVVMWWGLLVMALPIPGGWVTMVGPVMITYLILFVSGVPLLEEKYEGRKDFEEYKRVTSVFIPWFPKK